MNKNKLVYYFDTAALLQVQNPTSGDWVEVTSSWFRSYAGNRRIKGEEYIGPIFYEGTNYLYEGPLKGKIISIEEIDTTNLRKIKKTSKFAYSNEWLES
jgi:hypothetical protein